MTTPVAYTPLHAWQKTHEAQFADYGNWRLASVFSSVAEELAAARTCLALGDLSALGKISLQGKGVNDIMGSWLGEIKTGRVVPLNKEKFGWACMLSENHFLLLSSHPGSANIIDDLGQNLPGFPQDLSYDVTSGLTCLGLFGPEQGNILRQFTSLPVDRTGLTPGSCVQSAFAGIPGLLIAPPGSLSSTWILVAWDLAEYVWERLWQAGIQAGMVALGMEGYLAANTSPERR